MKKRVFNEDELMSSSELSAFINALEFYKAHPQKTQVDKMWVRRLVGTSFLFLFLYFFLLFVLNFPTLALICILTSFVIGMSAWLLHAKVSVLTEWLEEQGWDVYNYDVPGNRHCSISDFSYAVSRSIQGIESNLFSIWNACGLEFFHIKNAWTFKEAKSIGFNIKTMKESGRPFPDALLYMEKVFLKRREMFTNHDSSVCMYLSRLQYDHIRYTVDTVNHIDITTSMMKV